MHGQGIYTWKDGRKYDGNYFMDKKHGFGIYVWADGRKYEGMWENGKQHGEGRYTSADGKIRRAIWKDGKRVKWMDEDKQQASVGNAQGTRGFSPIIEDNFEE